MPKVSVVIPVYNVELWLEEALDSVIMQTLRDIEIICINDGSKDNSAAILERYESKDKRIRVITQENQGLSCARNSGITAAKGDYIYFMDSDDKIVQQALERLYHVAHGKSLDILYFDGSSFFDNRYAPENTFRPAYLRSKSYSEVLTGAALALQMIQRREYFSSACLMLLNREFVIRNNLTFYPHILHEDNLFSFQSFMAAKRVSHINEAFFLRRVREDSIMTRSQRPANLIGYLVTYIEVAKFMLSHKLNHVEQQAANLIVANMFNAAIRVYAELTPDARNNIDWSSHPLAGKMLDQIIVDLWMLYVPSQTVVDSDLPFNMEKRLMKELTQYKAMHKSILNSKSFILGRIITWIPRMTRNTIYSLMREGIKVTLFRKFPQKIRILFHMKTKKKSRQERKAEQQRQSTIMSIKPSIEEWLAEREKHLARQSSDLKRALVKTEQSMNANVGTQISDMQRMLSEVEKRLNASLGAQINDLKKALLESEQRLWAAQMQAERQFDTRLNTTYKDISGQCDAISHKLSSMQSNLQFQIYYRYRQSLTREQYPDALSEWYLKRTGEKLNLVNPQTYNEKIQWFKLYGITPLVTCLSDKYQVRDWVEKKIGAQYLVPLLGVWDKAEDIMFDKLPNRFVLKANHGCGFNLIVTNKDSLDRVKAVTEIKRWLEHDFAFWGGFELQYHNIQRKIIAEEYMENSNNDLFDYKVWCFNGRAEYIMFLNNRKNGLRMSFYDRDWNLTPISYDYPRNDTPVSKPGNLQELISVSEKLAEGFAHVRVDFYRLNNGRLIFGEMTFTSGSGTCKWDPPEYNRTLGNMIHYPGLLKEGKGDLNEGKI